MNRLVLDASVIIKWVFPGKQGEQDSLRALEILDAIRTGEAEVKQPPHWLAEVAAVLTRLDPSIARGAVELLGLLNLPVADDLGVMLQACDLSARLGHHLFDTLYHAVACSEPGRRLVTADERYYRKAQAEGSILMLRNFRLEPR